MKNPNAVENYILKNKETLNFIVPPDQIQVDECDTIPIVAKKAIKSTPNPVKKRTVTKFKDTKATKIKTHVVQKGQTRKEIADKYKTSIEVLAKNNPSVKWNSLKSGQIIVIK